MAGAVRAIADRTGDLLPAVAAVVRELVLDAAVGDLVGRTMLRLELGIPAEVVDLARLDGLRLTRGQWLSLNQSGLVTAETIRDAADDNLASILGSAAAAQSLKEAAENDEPDTVGELELPAPSE